MHSRTITGHTHTQVPNTKAHASAHVLGVHAQRLHRKVQEPRQQPPAAGGEAIRVSGASEFNTCHITMPRPICSIVRTRRWGSGTSL